MNTRKKLEISETNAGNTESKDKNMLLAMWITCVEQAGDVSKRRDTMNNWFMVLQGVLITAAFSYNTPPLGSLIICIIGYRLTFKWKEMILNYKHLNDAKFKVIDGLEKQLPSEPMYDEWMVIKEQQKYKNSTALELTMPRIFVIGLSALVLYFACEVYNTHEILNANIPVYALCSLLVIATIVDIIVVVKKFFRTNPLN